MSREDCTAIAAVKREEGGQQAERRITLGQEVLQSVEQIESKRADLIA